MPGMIRVASEDGTLVGYARYADLHLPPQQYMEQVNARTLWNVTDAQGNVVGYVAPGVPFIARADAEAPGFDLEKVRAARNGGCEDQIGDPTFQQEFPPCDDGSGGN